MKQWSTMWFSIYESHDNAICFFKLFSTRFHSFNSSLMDDLTNSDISRLNKLASNCLVEMSIRLNSSEASNLDRIDASMNLDRTLLLFLSSNSPTILMGRYTLISILFRIQGRLCLGGGSAPLSNGALNRFTAPQIPLYFRSTCSR